MQVTRESTCATAPLDRLQFHSTAIDKASLVRLEPNTVDSKLLPLSLKISKYWKLALSEVLRCKHPNCCTDHLSRGPDLGTRQPRTQAWLYPRTWPRYGSLRAHYQRSALMRADGCSIKMEGLDAIGFKFDL